MYTSEFVSPMHPDKICDRISALILDECLKQDPDSRVAIETLGGHKKIVVMGEITTKANIDFQELIQKEINDSSFEIITNISKQSPSIAQGVAIGGAGDQGIMLGYACSDTQNLMPLEYELARSLCKFIFNKYPFDGKTQITISGNKIIIDIVVSFQNVSKDILKSLVLSWLQEQNLDFQNINFWINESGDWNQGGFDSDTGLTGRKIVIDSYGPRIPVGGGAFSGKDSTKVDLSGALMARKVAVEMLKSTDSKEALVEVAYAIGKPEPLAVKIKINGLVTKVSQDIIDRFQPNNIIKELELKKPQFKELSKWGHFGNDNLWDK